MQSLKGFSKGMLVATSSDVKKATAPIRITSNKYTRGRVLILAGSEEWRGAMELAAYAAHNALAALRTEAGFVTVAAPVKILNLAGNISPVFVLKKLVGKPKDEVKELGKVRHDVLVVGPGLDEVHIPVKAFRYLLKIERKMGNTLVVDAAALHVFGKAKITGKEMILTPHDGEFKKMTGIDLKGKSVEQRMIEAKKFAFQHGGCTLVLKGNATVITDGKRLKVNVAKTPALATMGTGDVLAGMIAAYASQHKDRFESAVAAVHVHSQIGDTLYKKMGEHITADDVIAKIPDVLKKYDTLTK